MAQKSKNGKLLLAENKAILLKKVKTGKQSHFAVTVFDEATYKEFLWPKNDVGTKFCSKIVGSYPHVVSGLGREN